MLLLLCIGLFVAHKFVQRYGFDGIGEFISVYRTNLKLADEVEPQDLQLKISDADYDFLKKRRDVALERGIQINDGEDNYVECKIIQGVDTIKGEMRLKGHMTDHLEGDKWSFRVKTKKKPVFGMTRFSLQHPGTRNYAYEWVYHQLLKEEEVIHLNYDFIRLKLNDKDLGIYAIEEHFGQHVLDHNDRPKGAILRWNPNLYWEQRIDELQGTYLDEQYSDYASSFIEPYEKGAVEDDSVLIDTYVQGAAMLEAFRRGEKTTSEIFDVVKLARFHAIIDLVGGHHSLDWSDVKFFYNSESGKIEPVGYESFSVRKTESIAGQRIPDEYDELDFNYHNRLFSDPVFFEVYIQELERIADEKYLHAFIEKIQPELNKKLGVLAHEFPYRKFTFDPYFENIELIRHNLELPKAFHAFKESSTDSTVAISLTPVCDFPIEIISLIIDDKNDFELDSVFILPAKARNTYAHYFQIEFKYDSKKLKNLKLKARIPGSLNIFEVEVSDLPSYKQSSIQFDIKTIDSPADQLTHLNDTVSFFNAKDVVIETVYYLPDSNHTLKIFPGQQIHFLKSGKIISHGKIEMIGGTEEGETILISAEKFELDSGFMKEHIVLNEGKMTCINVDFFKSEDFIYSRNASIYFKNCSFGETTTDFIHALRSEIVITDCASGTISSFGVFDRSLVRIRNFDAKKGDVFIKSFGSDIDMYSSSIADYQTVSEGSYNASFSAWNCTFSAKENLFSLNFSSNCSMLGCTINDSKIGFIVDRERTNLLGDSKYELYRTSAENIDQLEQK
ncbi:MAG: CotH kinase family protein [Crocinitomicaceae bacterium]|nr:CotH kinase family protein [Crocinitomicaceae bacterium]